MKKDKKLIDKLLEEQRKNLRFVGSDSADIGKSGRFVTVDDVIEPEPVVSSSPAGSFGSNFLSQASSGSYGGKVDGYVDIRKFKMDRAKKLEAEEQENSKLNPLPDESELGDDDFFDDDFNFKGKNPNLTSAEKKVLREPNGTLDFKDVINSRPAAFGTNLDVVPEPKSVRRTRTEKDRVERRKKRVDADLIVKKTYATFFDDFEE